MLELEDECILEEFRELKSPVEDTSAFLVDEAPSEGSATYIPRENAVYLEPDEPESLKRKYVHEMAHAAYFENSERGQKIAELDQEVAEMEEELFGELLEEEAALVPDDEESGDLTGENVYTAEREDIMEYRSKRDRLESEMREIKPVLEGFALFMEERIFGDVELGERPPAYRNGYRVFRAEVKERGVRNAVNLLMEGRIFG